MTVGILIQARLKSKRLPYKLLRPLGGKTMIGYLIDRLKPLGFPIVLCTSTNEQDDPLEAIARIENVDCFRGSEDNLADRFFKAAHKFYINPIIRVTADNPLVDTNLMMDLLGRYEIERKFISSEIKFKGWGCQVFDSESLLDIIDEPDQEHKFIEYMHRKSGLVFSCWDKDLDVSIDTYEDYERVKRYLGY